MRSLRSAIFVAMLLASLNVLAQQASVAAPGAVPKLVNYSGVLNDANGKSLSAVRGVTFLLYKDEQRGAPLWMETQNITPDKNGHYTVTLGATRSEGLPADVFASGEARWLAVQVVGQPEQSRVLLVAVPYAMKAKDADTIGGLPPSAFVLAAPVVNGAAPTSAPAGGASGATSSAPPASNVTTTGGTVNAIPLFTTATNIQNSIMTQTAATAINVGGKLNLPTTGTATALAGKNSRPEAFVASAFNKTTSTALAQTFQLQAEPAGNNTATPAGTLNLLYASGTAVPAETGLKISKAGVFTFAPGQTFPGAGTGTVKSVGLTAPVSDFTVSGSPVTTTGTLDFAWAVAPTSADTANAIVKRDASGNFSAGTVGASALNTSLVSATAVNATDVTLTDELSVTSASATGISAGSANPLATVTYSIATSTTGDAWGVEGATDSSASTAYGVIGYAGSSTGTPIGVYGKTASPSGIGTFGQNGIESGAGNGLYGTIGTVGIGVWGDGGTTPGNKGVIGTTDDGNAGIFVNNGPTYYTLFAGGLNSTTFPFRAENSATGAYCLVDPSGNLLCSGTKNAVVPIDGGKRKVALSAIESPVNWFEDAGSGQLVNGAAVVQLDPDFIQTVNTEMDYHLFLTPGGECKGLYFANKTTTSFEVRELGGGTSSERFDYRIMAMRKKYESVRFADHTNDPDPTKQLAEIKARGGKAQPQSHDPVKKPMPIPAKSALLTRPVAAVARVGSNR